jgi:hypothetical protein
VRPVEGVDERTGLGTGLDGSLQAPQARLGVVEFPSRLLEPRVVGTGAVRGEQKVDRGHPVIAVEKPSDPRI